MVFNNNLLLGAAGQGGGVFDSTLIGNSAWFNGTDSRMDSPSFSAQSDPTCFTFATWVQILDFSISPAGQYLWSAERTSNYASIRIDENNILKAYSNPAQFESSMIFRDTGWYHIICSFNGPDNTVRMFVNGNEIDVTKSNANNLATNPEPVAFSHTQRIGAYYVGATGGDLYEANSYMAQTVFLDGFSFQDGDITVSDFLDTYTFGTNGSQFIPKKNSELATLAGTAGANSYVLDYADSSNLGNDISSKNNDFTLTNMSSANQSTNTPSNVYATWNALDSALDGHFTDMTLGEGNTVTENGNGAFCRSTFAIPEGLFAYRVTVDDSTNNQMFGVALDTAVDRANANTNHPGMYAVNAGNGSKNTNGTGSSQYTAWSDGDTMEVYVSRSGTTYKVWYGKNGTLLNGASGSQGDPSAGTNELFNFTHTGDVFFSVDYTNAGTKKATTDFGQRGYSPAEGALTLNTANFTAPDYQGIDYFDATLYEGNGTGQRVGDFVPFTDSYTVDNSAMLDDGDTRYFYRTPSGAGNRKTFTLSTWFKRSTITGATQYLFHCQNSANNNLFTVQFNASDQIVAGGEISGGATDKKVTTNRVFKDTSQWYHLVVRVDTPQSTAADRLRIYINGVEQSFASAAYRNTTEDWLWNAASELHTIARGQSSGSASGTSSDLYLAETVHIDGTSLGPDSFGQLDTSTNRWIPKDVSGLTFGTNGFYLEYEGTFGTSNGAGDDSSGNSPANNFTEGGTWATSDQFTDTPSQNFAVMNPGDQDPTTATTLSEGNLKVSMGTAAGDGVRGTLSYNGKMYWEVELDSVATNSGSDIGIATKNHNLALESKSASNTNAFLGVSSFDSNLRGFFAGSPVDTSYGGLGNNFATAGKYLMFAVDISAGKFWAGYDGTWFNSGDPAAGTNDSGFDLNAFDTWFPAISRIGSASSEDFIFNFGQRSFAHTVPTGFVKLNQDNLDDTSSKITAFAWIKNRDSTDSHILVDRVRGTGEVIHSNETAAEATEPNTVQRFLQRGVQVGSDVQVNTANESYVLWQWLVGDSATTGTVIPADNPPSIASTVVAADAGHFSVGTYIGSGVNATVGHGLGGAPEMIIVKNRDQTDDWPVYHVGTATDPETDVLYLNYTLAVQDSPFFWNDTAPTSSVFSIGTGVAVNTLNENYVFYAFRSIPGVCKVGKYIGNGDSTNAPYISLGFTPRYILIKNIDAAQNWMIWDTARSPYNQLNNNLWTDLNSGESTSSTYGRDILSDGFKLRGSSHAIVNASGNTYIYLAMADLGGNGTLPPIYGR